MLIYLVTSNRGLKELIKYLKKRRKNIRSLLTTPRLHCTPGIFHDLRVEIKKLRSLISLLRFSASFNLKKIDKPFIKVFKQAGKIREMQIEEEMLQQYFSIDFLHDYRQKIKEHKSKELRNYINLINEQSERIKKAFTKIKPWIQIINKKELDEFTDKKEKNLKQLLDQNITPPQLHLLRKRIKQYNYALKFSLRTNKLNFETDSYSLSDLLGKWHDGQVLIYHLERQMHYPGISESELEEIKKIRYEKMMVNNLILTEIRAAIGKISSLLD